MNDENNEQPITDPLTTPKTESALSGVSDYFKLLKGSLFEPIETYKKLNFTPLSIPYALFFAVSVHWAGSALEFIWKSSLGKLFSDRASFFANALEKLFNETADTNHFPFEGLKEQFIKWIWGIGSVIIDPLKTLHQVLILSVFIWLAGKIFHEIPKEDEHFEMRLSYPMALTLVAIAQGPSLLQGIPLYGSIISTILSFITLTLGAHLVYRTTKMRGALIASFPSLIYYGSILVGIGILLGFAFNFLSQFIWSM